MRKIERISAALATLFLAACSGGGGPVEQEIAASATATARAGAFTGGASGAVNHPSMEGRAVFWLTEAAKDFFVLNLYPAKGGRVSLIRFAPDRPEPGEYGVENDATGAQQFSAMYVPESGPNAVFESGRITISESTAGRLTGSYELEGVLFDITNLGQPPQTVRMQGTFAAVCDDSATGNVCR